MTFEEAHWLSQANRALTSNFGSFSTQQLKSLFLTSPQSYWDNLLNDMKNWEKDDKVTPDFIAKFVKLWETKERVTNDAAFVSANRDEVVTVLKLAVEIIGDVRRFKWEERYEEGRIAVEDAKEEAKKEKK
jgi:hypothetical protein